MTQCWWLYLLVCRDGRTYAGIATDVAARFVAHSSGKGAKFTRSNPPVRVLGVQAFAGKSEALKAEAALKKRDIRRDTPLNPSRLGVAFRKTRTAASTLPVVAMQHESTVP
jgi:putative endonuclease